MYGAKKNKKGNKARQTRPKCNESHANADVIYTKPSMTHPNYYEIYSKPNERVKNVSRQSASSMTFHFHQAITDSQNTPRTLQAHCQAQTAV